MNNNAASEWTLEQASELILEQFVTLLDGCDDDDTVRPAMVFTALKEVWSPHAKVEWDDTITAGQMRERMRAARRNEASR